MLVTVEKMDVGAVARVATAHIKAHTHLTEHSGLHEWLLVDDATDQYRVMLIAVRKKTLAYMFITVTDRIILHMASPNGQLKSRAISTAQNGKVKTN